MKTLKDFNFKNKRVLVRCDFNVPLDERGNILDDFRIKQSIATIEHLIKEGAKVILMSHSVFYPFLKLYTISKIISYH